MAKQIELLEGQTGSLTASILFENKAAADKVTIHQTLSNADLLKVLKSGELVVSGDKKTVVVPIQVGALGNTAGDLVFKYTGNESEVEKVGINTHALTINVSAAELAVNTAPTKTKFKWVPGAALELGVDFKNGTQVLENDDSNLAFSIVGDGLEFVSTADGKVALKIKDSADPATLPTDPQQLVATYFSGTTSIDLSFFSKPELTLQAADLEIVQGNTQAFPIGVYDGDTLVNDKINNITATHDGNVEVDQYGNIRALTFDADNATQVVAFSFDYTDAEGEVWNYSKDVNVTILAPSVAYILDDVETPLTMNLWESKNMVYVVKADGTDITNTVTSAIVTNADDIKDKFEVTIDGGTITFKSVSSSTTETVKATASVLIGGTYNGTEYTVDGGVQLITNINNGEIPTNRFDVQMEE